MCIRDRLAAIITTPKGATNFPMVVLVHGSGPSDLDGTVGPNKPLKDIADGLACKGIGSIRYVKRTVVYAAEFGKAFTVKEEVLDDAVAAIALAKTVKGADVKSIYVLGHSLGGMLAPRIATLVPDIKGIIPVSYTHLDVYKRQEFMMCWKSLIFSQNLQRKALKC